MQLLEHEAAYDGYWLKYDCVLQIYLFSPAIPFVDMSNRKVLLYTYTSTK